MFFICFLQKPYEGFEWLLREMMEVENKNDEVDGQP